MPLKKTMLKIEKFSPVSLTTYFTRASLNAKNNEAKSINKMPFI